LGNQLFGDDELLLVAPSDEGKTLVLRALTGELVGERTIAPFEKRMTTVGRMVLSWDRQGAAQVMEMRDPWEDRALWSFKFATGAKADLVSQEAVAVLEPDGDFTLVRLADGKALVHERLEAEKSLLSIHLLKSVDHYLLVTNSAARRDARLRVQPLPNAVNFPMISGLVYAFDRKSGERAWPAPAAIAQYSLITNQPAHLPLLAFVRQEAERPGGAGAPKTSLVCLDKRTGRVAYQNDDLPPTTGADFDIAGDPLKHALVLTLPPKVLELTLTDQELEAPASP
jgi:hypothetical protein